MKLAPALLLALLLALPSITSAAGAPTGAPASAAPAPPTPTPITNAPRTTIPVYIGRDPDLIADSDTLITQIIPLQYLNAVELRNNLTILLKPGTPIVATNDALVVTESSSIVKRIVQIIAFLDVRSNPNVIAIIPLRSGNAAEAARQINAVFNSQPPQP